MGRGSWSRWVPLIGCLAAGPAPGAETSLVLESVGLEDGDTLLVVIGGTSERVQLVGIDAPEDVDNPKLRRDLERTGLTREVLLPLGEAATTHLRALVAGPGPYRLLFDPDRRDRYARLTARLLDPAGQSLNARMVEDGFAIPLPDPAPADPESAALAEAKARAIASARGLWGSQARAMGLWSGQERP